jgi:hypothetical protein
MAMVVAGDAHLQWHRAYHSFDSEAGGADGRDICTHQTVKKTDIAKDWPSRGYEYCYQAPS